MHGVLLRVVGISAGDRVETPEGIELRETIEELDEVSLDEIKWTHEIWVKAERTLLGLWLPRDLPENACHPPSEWEDVWDEGGEHVHYALEVSVEDFERLGDELNRRDIDFKRVEHNEYGGAQSVFVRDPAGHTLEFAQKRLRREVEAEMTNPQQERSHAGDAGTHFLACVTSGDDSTLVRSSSIDAASSDSNSRIPSPRSTGETGR